MPDLRAIVTIAVPAMTALFGLLWFFGRKKEPLKRKLSEPPDKKVANDKSAKQEVSDQNVSVIETETKDSRPAEVCVRSDGDNTVKKSVIDECSSSQTTPLSCEGDVSPELKRGDLSNNIAEENSPIKKAVTVEQEIIQETMAQVNEIPCKSKPENEESSLPISSLTEMEPSVEAHVLKQILTPTDIDNVRLAPAWSFSKSGSDSKRRNQSPLESSVNNTSGKVSDNTSKEVNSLLENDVATHSNIEKSETSLVNSQKEIASSDHEIEIKPLEQANEVKPTEEIAEKSDEQENESDKNSVTNHVESSELNDKPDTEAEEGSADKICNSTSTPDETVTSNNDSEVADKSQKVIQNEDVIAETSAMSRSWHEEVEESGVATDIVDVNANDSNIVSNSNDVKNHEKVSGAKSNKSPGRNDRKAQRNQNKSSSKVSPDKQKDEGQSSSDASSNCDNLSEASNDSGKGGSVSEPNLQSPESEDRVFEFNIPSDICGLFIGTRGKTVKMLRDQSGARIRLRNNPYTPEFQICVIEGNQRAIDKACSIIGRKFPSIKYPGMDMQPTSNPVIMPEIMQLSLPEGVSLDIVVSSIVDAGRVFVQQPTHPTYPSLERLNSCMNQCYMQEGNVPDIPRPIESGVICAAPMLNGWYRAQIMTTLDSDECDIKYVDYGGYSRVSSLLLKQIRSDFMTLPFEAVECYLANITFLKGETYFSMEAAVVLEELTQGKLLQAQVVGQAEDGIPYVNIFQILPNSGTLLVNREMVNRGVVRWVEMPS